MKEADLNKFTNVATEKKVLSMYNLLCKLDKKQLDPKNKETVIKSIEKLIKDLEKTNKEDKRFIIIVNLLYKLCTIVSGDEQLEKAIRVYKTGNKEEKEVLKLLRESLNNIDNLDHIELADFIILINYLNTLENKREDYLIETGKFFGKKLSNYKLNKNIAFVYAYDVYKETENMNKVKRFITK